MELVAVGDTRALSSGFFGPRLSIKYENYSWTAYQRFFDNFMGQVGN